ncbi:MAG: type IV secretion system protein [Burkholderiales bacterium]|jgi:type IV secretion system protein VirB6|nr:type IV secretion system protein [Burkholderiales bacterium]
MFFGNWWTWLQGVLANYVAYHTLTVAATLAPTVGVLAAIFVMAWGALMLTGRIEEPILEGIKRIVTIGLILGIGFQLWVYNDLIVDTFFQAPFQLANALVGAPPVTLLDQIWNRGSDIAGLFWMNAGVWNGNVGLYIAAGIVWAVTLLLTAYVMFLLSLARVALAVLIALGPLFIALLFFETTKRFFEAWIAQLANYAFVGILSGLVAALMLKLVDDFAAQTLGVGSGIKVQDVGQYLLATVIAFLLMRQVMPIAAGLAGGIALSTTNAFSRALMWGLGVAGASGRGALDAATGQGTTRWDPMVRKLGYYPTRAVVRTGQAIVEPAWRRVRRPRNTLTQKNP